MGISPHSVQMAAEEDGFIVVSGRKAGKRRVWKLAQRLHSDETVNIARLTLKIESLIRELKESQFYSDLTCAYTPPSLSMWTKGPTCTQLHAFICLQVQ